VNGFQPSAVATLWQYGKAQDTAQSKLPSGSAALAHFIATLTVTGSNFSYQFPSYSMTVLDLAPAKPQGAAPAFLVTFAAPALSTADDNIRVTSAATLSPAPSATRIVSARMLASGDSDLIRVDQGRNYVLLT